MPGAGAVEYLKALPADPPTAVVAAFASRGRVLTVRMPEACLRVEHAGGWLFSLTLGYAAKLIVAGRGLGMASIEEQTEFNVMLVEAGEKKVNVIKAVRELTGVGLKEAKAIVDGTPAMVLEAAWDAAQKAKAAFEEAGARVELR